MNTIKKILSSKKTFAVILALFVVQSAFFVFTVDTPDHRPNNGAVIRGDGGVPPDESRHVGNILYYAQRPLFSSPVSLEAQPGDLWLGEIERFPSYLYYYVMGFPARASLSLGFSVPDTVVILRLINVIIGVLGLYILKRTLRLARIGNGISNAVILALSMTGAYVWMSSAVSYDMPSLVLYFAILLYSVKALTSNSLKPLAPILLLTLVLSITKYTYIPFSGLVILFTLGVIGYRLGYKNLWSRAKLEYLAHIKKHKYSSVVIAVLLLIFGGLVVERIGVNLLKYNSFDPVCSKIHSVEACKEFPLFVRGLETEERLTSGDLTPLASYNTAEHTGQWLARYYNSLYFYYGNVPKVPPSTNFVTPFVLSTVAILLMAVLNRRKLLHGLTQKYLVYGAVFYVLALYTLNLSSYLKTGLYNANQGRYLLPALAFIYLLVILLITEYYKQSGKWARRAVLFVAAPLLLITGILHSPAPAFYSAAETPEWYSQRALDILPRWITSRSPSE